MSYAPLGSELIVTNGNLSSDERSTFSKPLSKRARGSTSAPSIYESDRLPFRADYPIIVHCHLCWDWVWQRPQQFLSRLSVRHRILFVETIGPDPQLSSAIARFWTAPNYPNITILRLQFPEWRWSDGAFVDRERRRLVKEFISGPGAGQFENPVQWFYDPMAVPAFLGWFVLLPRLRFSDADERLFLAARHGDRAGVEQALVAGAHVNAESPADGKAALSRAAIFGHGVVVRLLLERGADAAARGADGRSLQEPMRRQITCRPCRSW